MNRSWASNYLARWLFRQNRIWITADGRELKISKMEPTHLLNTLLMLERVHADVELVVGKHVQDTPLYKALYRRMEKLLNA